jgi:hypothetical protein
VRMKSQRILIEEDDIVDMENKDAAVDNIFLA